LSAFTESVVEDAALAWLEALGYAVKHDSEIAAGEPAAERSDAVWHDLVPTGTFHPAGLETFDQPTREPAFIFGELRVKDAERFVRESMSC
jgi:hypothetical protein